MIKVQRTPKPALLKKKSHIWTKALLSCVNIDAWNKQLNKYQNPKIREALESMFHGKCAYCESKITHVSFGHIEHYRPKQKYPERAFLWRNLLLACERCNNAKLDHFPDVVQGGPLINPVKNDPNQHFRFFYDPTAQLATVIPTTKQGKTTEQLLKLNRPDLRSHRSTTIKRLYMLKIYAKQGDSEAIALWQEAQSNNAEYAAFARSLPDCDQPSKPSNLVESTVG